MTDGVTPDLPPNSQGSDVPRRALKTVIIIKAEGSLGGKGSEKEVQPRNHAVTSTGKLGAIGEV